jgi:hypothetical protein
MGEISSIVYVFPSVIYRFAKEISVLSPGSALVLHLLFLTTATFCFTASTKHKPTKYRINISFTGFERAVNQSAVRS